MNPIEIICNNETETSQLGAKLGSIISSPMVIFLSGTLGAGKTRLAQAIAQGLDIDPTTVNSPTFTIMVPHKGRKTLLHVDAYRINDLDEADQLGIDDWVDDGCVLIVEWAERIEKVLPPADLRIHIASEGETLRRFSITPQSEEGKKICVSLLSVD